MLRRPRPRPRGLYSLLAPLSVLRPDPLLAQTRSALGATILSDFHLTITMLALQTGVGRMAEWSMAADCKSARVKRSKVRILLRPRCNLHIIFLL